MIRTQGKFASYGEIWFQEEPVAPLPDILLYRQRLEPSDEWKGTKFTSLATDLRAAEDQIWTTIEKGTRYEIRRAESRDSLDFKFWRSPAASAIDEFSIFHETFAARKHLLPASAAWLKAATATGQLCLSTARCEGKSLVWHAYVVSGPFGRLYQSASHFRGSGTDFAARIARANRLLHWRDMLEFKRQGFESYDWGGIFEGGELAEHANINRFKRAFGGSERVYYDWQVPVTRLSRLYLPARALWSRVRSKWPSAGYRAGS